MRTSLEIALEELFLKGAGYIYELFNYPHGPIYPSLSLSIADRFIDSTCSSMHSKSFFPFPIMYLLT